MALTTTEINCILYWVLGKMPLKKVPPENCPPKIRPPEILPPGKLPDGKLPPPLLKKVFCKASSCYGILSKMSLILIFVSLNFRGL